MLSQVRSVGACSSRGSQWLCHAQCTMHNIVNMHKVEIENDSRSTVSKVPIFKKPTVCGEGALPHQQSTSDPASFCLLSPQNHGLACLRVRILYIHSTATMIPLRTFHASLSRRCSAPTTTLRKYASQTPGTPMLEVFNRKVKHLQKDRAARNVEQSRKVDYLKDEVAMRLCERLLVSHPTKQARKTVQK